MLIAWQKWENAAMCESNKEITGDYNFHDIRLKNASFEKLKTLGHLITPWVKNPAKHKKCNLPRPYRKRIKFN